MDDSDRFRAYAERCHKIGNTCADPLGKEAWLKLAADWLGLAERADGFRTTLVPEPCALVSLGEDETKRRE